MTGADALWLTIRVALAATFIACIGGVSVAALLTRRRFIGRDLIDSILTAPMVLPPTVLGYYVLVALGARSPIGKLYESITGTTIVFSATGAIVAAAIGAFPMVARTSRAAFEAVDPRLVAASRTLGASPLRSLLTIEIPLAARGIIAGTTLGFARALGDFGVTLMVAGDIPGKTQTASLYIYDAIQAQRSSDAVAVIVVLTLFAIVPLYFVNKLSKPSHG
jgi:molybdate transport system permease protein